MEQPASIIETTMTTRKGVWVRIGGMRGTDGTLPVIFLRVTRLASIVAAKRGNSLLLPIGQSLV
jgi:hypothetical protein